MLITNLQSNKFRFVGGLHARCRMTLLLGPPSSGKTTLLLALAGKLDPSLKVKLIHDTNL